MLSRRAQDQRGDLATYVEVLVMSGGEIIEDGPPDLLLTGSGRYSALHASWQSSLA